ncbi:MAG: hypothetical protein ACN2B6_12325 [Rickettsiales bacterium]
MATTEIVYKNRDNPNVVAFYVDNVAMDFSAVTRAVLKLYNRNNVLLHTEDSSTSPSLLSWSTNEITFTLNDVVLDKGRYFAQVTVYDSTHPDGQAIAHPQSPNDRLIFEFVHA